MADIFKDLLSSGRQLITDTKSRKMVIKPEPSTKSGKLRSVAEGSTPETDPHKNLVKKTIQDRPKKAELVKEFQRLCEIEESKL